MPSHPLDPSSYQHSTRDGRSVSYSLYGNDEGSPVVFHYGTPGTRLLPPMVVDLVVRHGVQLLVPDRPGYGLSTRRPGRNVADVVEDVAELVDAHGWARFATWGGSGGAPHALACAALLGDRVDRCASVVGPAPFEAIGLDWFEGMSPGNVEEFVQARLGEEAYRPLVERLAREAISAAEAGEIPLATSYELPDADITALQRRTRDEGYVERTHAMYAGVDGWVDDCTGMTRPWGFDLSTIAVPVSVWFGPDDVLSPRRHAEWLLTHLPGSDRRELPHGHLLTDEDLGEIYVWLTQPV